MRSKRWISSAQRRIERVSTRNGHAAVARNEGNEIRVASKHGVQHRRRIEATELGLNSEIEREVRQLAEACENKE